jgi:hypothetical protein
MVPVVPDIPFRGSPLCPGAGCVDLAQRKRPNRPKPRRASAHSRERQREDVWQAVCDPGRRQGGCRAALRCAPTHLPWRDRFGAGNKFVTPMVAQGKVYVATTEGVGVFGLLPKSKRARAKPPLLLSSGAPGTTSGAKTLSPPNPRHCAPRHGEHAPDRSRSHHSQRLTNQKQLPGCFFTHQRRVPHISPSFWRDVGKNECWRESAGCA